MRQLTDKLVKGLKKHPNKPTMLLFLEDTRLYQEKTSAADWLFGMYDNVDMTSVTGDVLIPFVNFTGANHPTVNNFVDLGYTQNSYLQQYTNNGGYAWQSFKHSNGLNCIINKVGVYLYTAVQNTNVWSITFTVGIYQSDKTTLLGSKTVGGSNFSCDGIIELDFSSLNISLATGTTYYIKITVATSTPQPPTGWNSAHGYCAFQTTGDYADGSFLAHPCNISGEWYSTGDLGFTVSYLPQFKSQAMMRNIFDMTAAPTVDGNWLVEQYVPTGTSLAIRAWTMESLAPTAYAQYSLSAYGFRGIAYNGTLFVMTCYGAGSTKYYTSPDGGTWTLRDHGIAAAWQEIAWNGNVFCMINENGTIAATSPDGLNWTQRAMATSQTWYQLKAGNGVFIAVGNGGVCNYSSNDGANWSSSNLPSSGQWYGAAFGNGTFVAIKYNSNAAAYSTDKGVTWYSQTLPATANWYCVEHNGGQFFAMVDGATTTAYSYDGQTWFAGAASPGAYNWRMMCRLGNVMYAMALNQQYLYYTTDGQNWTSVSQPSLPATHHVVRGCVGYGLTLVVCSFDQNWAATITATGQYYLAQVHDGDAAYKTLAKRYFVTEAILTANTAKNLSPQLKTIGLSFKSFKTYADSQRLGYEVILKSVSGLQTTIDAFQESTIGQISVTVAMTPNISKYLATKYPKNREARVKIGLDEPGFAESDYADYYRGYIDDWSVKNDGTAVLKLRDFSKSWKGIKIPPKWEKSPDDDKVYSTMHPVDVLYDLMLYANTSSRFINSSSLLSVKNATPDWLVTRTLKDRTYDVKDLIEEVRKLLSAYIIPNELGEIRLKRYDPDEAVQAVITDSDMKNVSYDANSKGLINQAYIYYNHDGSGQDDAKNFTGLSMSIDATSISNWNETNPLEVKDFWTRKAQAAQIQDRNQKIITRYAAMPWILSFELDLRWAQLEVGDMLDLRTATAPSSDGQIYSYHYQIISANLDFKAHKISLKCLKA